VLAALQQGQGMCEWRRSRRHGNGTGEQQRGGAATRTEYRPRKARRLGAQRRRRYQPKSSRLQDLLHPAALHAGSRLPSRGRAA
jgi:hypothetical protein